MSTDQLPLFVAAAAPPVHCPGCGWIVVTEREGARHCWGCGRDFDVATARPVRLARPWDEVLGIAPVLGASPPSQSPVDFDRAVAQKRGSTASRPSEPLGSEIPFTRCARTGCEGPVRRGGRGRAPRFCSDACRQAAGRERRAHSAL